MSRYAMLLLLLMSPTYVLAATFEATVQWRQRVELSLPVSGVISTVDVSVGDRVTRGQRLLSIDTRRYDAAVRAAESGVERSRGDRTASRRELARAQELYDREVLATVELDFAKLEFSRADAEFKRAQAHLDRALYDREHSELHAPFDGIVIQRSVEVGQNIIATLESPVLVVLARADSYLAVFSRPLDELADAIPGTAATVIVDGKRFAGRITSVGMEAVANGDEAPPAYPVTVEFDAQGELLRAGTPARVELR